MGVAVLLVAAGVGGYLWLRPAGETTASVTDPALPISEASTGAAEPTGDRSADTTRSPASGGSAPGGPTSVRSTPTSAGTTSFVPVPTGATADCSAPDSIDAAGVTQTYEPAKAFDGKRETAW